MVSWMVSGAAVPIPGPFIVEAFQKMYDPCYVVEVQFSRHCYALFLKFALSAASQV